MLNTPGAEMNDGGHELEEWKQQRGKVLSVTGLLLERKFLSFHLIFLQSFWVTLPLTHTHRHTHTVTAAVLFPFP